MSGHIEGLIYIDEYFFYDVKEAESTTSEYPEPSLEIGAPMTPLKNRFSKESYKHCTIPKEFL